MQIVSSPRLGFVGFGASKEDALAAYRDAQTALDADFKAAATNFPKAAYSIRIWDRIMPIEKDFYRDRDDTAASSRGITMWGDRVEKANQYKQTFLDAKAAVVARATVLKEKPVDATYDPQLPGKKKGDVPWALIGGGAAALLVLGLVLRGKRPGA